MKCRIVPASMAAAIIGMELFGLSRVDPGSWLEPVRVDDVAEEEYNPVRDLLMEKGFDLIKE
jgi:hypothetical protein